jgi:hypothetical protein
MKLWIEQRWFQILTFLFGAWLSQRLDVELEAIEPSSAEALPTAAVSDYRNWSREPDESRQGKDLLVDEEAWLNWLESYGPDACLFKDTPPESYPCVIVWTWKLGLGVVRMAFYWDFVYPGDFPPPPVADPAPPPPPSGAEPWGI